MKIDLRDLKEDVSSIHLKLVPEELGLVCEGATFGKAVDLDLTLRRGGEDLFCTGEARTELEMECCRCLESFPYTLKTRIEFLVRVGKDQIEIEYQDQAEPLIFPGGQSFSIDSLVKEAILLSLPVKPLCTEECKGLCPMCGANLNSSSCGCRKEKADTRWEKLKDLFKG